MLDMTRNSVLLLVFIAPSVAHFGIGWRPAPGSRSGQLSPGDKEQVWLQYASCLRQHGASEPVPGFDSLGNPQAGQPQVALADSRPGLRIDLAVGEPPARTCCEPGESRPEPGSPSACGGTASTTSRTRIRTPPRSAPSATGDLDPQSPRYQQAQQACWQYLDSVKKGG